MLHPLAVGDEARILAELGHAHRLAQPHELLVVADREHERHVGAVEDLPRAGELRGGAVAHRHLARDQIVHGDMRDRVHLRVEQREIDVLAAARHLVAVVERGKDRDRRVLAGGHVGDAVADEIGARPRLPVGHAGDAHQAAHGLEDRIVAGQLAVRPGLPEAGDRAIDETRVDCSQCRVVEIVAREVAGLEVLDQHIGRRGQLLHQRLASDLADIDGHRPLAAIHRQIGRRLAGLAALRVFLRDAQPAHVVAVDGMLDLDHVGAEIGQHLARPGAGEDAAEIENADMRQATGHGDDPSESGEPRHGSDLIQATSASTTAFGCSGMSA